MSRDGWIGVDFDGTLAVHEVGKGLLPLGAPVPKMVARVRRWLEQGEDVRIFTARMSDPDKREVLKHRTAIENWCEEHLGKKLPVTCVKDYSLVRFYDDRAVQVQFNTGELIGSEE